MRDYIKQEVLIYGYHLTGTYGNELDMISMFFVGLISIPYVIIKNRRAGIACQIVTKAPGFIVSAC